MNSILFQAVEARASDIHVEPYEKELKIRFRVDGVLHERQSLDRNYSSALVSRLKIMAHLNIAERRLPQDGRSRVRIGGHGIDLRVATIPTAGGERVVLRLLDKASTKLSYDQLGLLPAAQARFRRLLELTHGIVLLTGPTGSGKTTTLYSALNELNKPMRNILTVEDPIEYDIPGVAQIQVQPKIGLTFAGALRHMLRQDPDIMMVGEIRDLETAEIAIQAALTGHLVLSTLHTNDSAAAVTRLLDMGVEPFLVSSAVVGIMAQRLVRCICPKCGTSEAAGSDAIAVFLQAGLRLPTGTRLPVPRGCAHCSNTGYRGRKAISELLLVDDRIRQTIMDHGTANTLRDAATARGMETLRMDGLKKVLAGETTVAEVIRVTQGELLQYE